MIQLSRMARSTVTTRLARHWAAGPSTMAARASSVAFLMNRPTAEGAPSRTMTTSVAMNSRAQRKTTLDRHRLPAHRPYCPTTVAALPLANGRSSFSTSATMVGTSPPATIELFQYAICPFCNKTKAFLDYSGLPYTSIEVNPLTKAEIKWSKDYRKVPIGRLSSTSNNDDDAKEETSSVIFKGSDDIVDGLLAEEWVIQQLEQTKWADTDMTMSKFLQDQKEWIEYTNEKLAVLLYPNLCPTLSASYQAFSYVDSVDTFSAWQRFSIRTVGSFAMYMAASRVKKKHNIEDERLALQEVLKTPVQHLSDNQQSFLSGQSEPHLGDLAVFGALKGIQGTAIHAEILEGQPILAAWYQRMQEKVSGQ
mmetsp:Transcript_19021/g.39380  ORF Transcript_19021/g.39380 Transcript_19021/m.39380 type:complete len:365 (-) Transcript_19021:1248-2342(-)